MFCELIASPNDYSPLFLKCFQCNMKGHIAIDCKYFNMIKGNLLNEEIKTNNNQALRKEMIYNWTEDKIQ